jgi:hypothetical protein
MTGNKLSGVLPSDFATKLTKLTDLILNTNLLTGPLPAFGATNPFLRSMYVGRRASAVSPRGPPAVCLVLAARRNSVLTRHPHVPRLPCRTLYGNQLTGTIPATFGSLAALSSLNIANNNLGGTIPDLSAVVSLVSLCASPALRCGAWLACSVDSTHDEVTL